MGRGFLRLTLEKDTRDQMPDKVVRIFCINCGKGLNWVNSEEPPFLCSGCRSGWKEPKDFASMPYLTREQRQLIIVVAVNSIGITGVFDPARADPDNCPKILWGIKRDGKPKYFQPKAVRRIFAVLAER